ncbi:gamma-glutamyl-gamma-aminobutyrate hydrolase [Devosia soli]|uniref:gamma-glutamyl-gamma-aminobutyrate hydrolase n=1 Tax=Devosia soli TaxID=361041 RepID=A0A0F5L776_9HYPH|nr:gamma-glutamyl-gamma-aminobutyrate hydrolase family protein [Devosia soli]KKB78256.1 gamma-glutamyl-gamma-aminobutyrate hydrolase [Devosia soli]
MALKKPVIGVIACERIVEGEPAQAVKHRYLEAVEQHAQAVPMVIPTNQDQDNAAAIVERLDALLLTGSGSNIEPRRYGSDSPAMAPTDPGRDTFGAALIHAAITAGKPVFGICRGLQEINVALGGTLRDMRAQRGADLHHAPDGANLEDTFAHGHDIEVAPGSVLQRFASATALKVNSVHFQTIDRLGEGLVANATGPSGVIEAISALKTPAPVFAVQWHPEWQPEGRPHDLAFWKYLGEVARANYLPAPGSETT